MFTLFPQEQIIPDGFSYKQNFITPEEEIQLLEFIDKLELSTLVFQGFTAKRKVLSFGYDYNFDNRKISKGRPIPSDLDFLTERIAALTSLSSDQFAEVLITEYPIGSVINWHRDAPPFDIITGVSLLSSCKFRLRPHDKSKQKRGNIISIPVERRSLYLLKNEIRSEWEHSIASLKTVRYSITFRTLKVSEK